MPPAPSDLASADESPTPVPTHDTAAETIEDEHTTEVSDGPVHPMAHLMPGKTAPSEASRKAAQLRAAKKARAKRIKFGVAVGFIVAAVVVGPPLWNWLTDTFDESGSITTDEPAD